MPSRGTDTAVTKRRLGVLMAASVAAAALAAVVIAATRSSPRPPTAPLKPVSDVNSSTRACLFEAPAGTPAGAAALRGLTQAARARKDILVQQFAVPANVSPAAMLAELVALRCQTIVAVGSQAEAQVAARAGSTSAIRYLVIGTGLPAASNITVIPPAGATPGAVESAVLRVVSARSPVRT